MPAEKLVTGVYVQRPFASTVIVVTTTLPSLITTCAPASAVPLICGFAPTVAPAAGVEITGTSVAASTVNVREGEDLVFPKASVAVTMMLCAPALNTAVTEYVHAPNAFALAVPSTAVPSLIVTLAFFSAEPEMVGFVPTLAPSAGAVTIGTSVVSSTVKPRFAEEVVPTVATML